MANNPEVEKFFNEMIVRLDPRTQLHGYAREVLGIPDPPCTSMVVRQPLARLEKK